MLDILMFTLETHILLDIRDVERIEKIVADLPPLDMDKHPGADRENITQLVTDLQNTLKGAIKLLDAAHWMQRTAAMLLEFGQQLDEITPDGAPGIKREWAEIKDFLQDLERVTAYLEPRPRYDAATMPIPNSYCGKMAQEDNVSASRMAVSATRDSSSMKVLAVITALFLPGSYIATLSGMSMFDWQRGGDSSNTTGSNGTSTDARPGDDIVMPYIWIYWVITIILTFIVMISWRIWFTTQDRKFKKELPRLVEPGSAGKKNQPRRFWKEFLGIK
ncbi:uncharacterized protein Z518_10863 [Rhinocladiella mackenziei CBS 650.93]|uniref:Uncharacterized protein n=1 Tax=Rhinocladiella mackenziei CBS 650.93 TaxID=1442369 RepID=A0A0D2I9J6_9EURO|nr:uncharacterized protein Z518_10863 [Rhinocladiella mackenziei CBS 650.93]KIW99935.1 hypothetical protein Z518_10863 [Rhinocladiella mackenziei CBS 650.93]